MQQQNHMDGNSATYMDILGQLSLYVNLVTKKFYLVDVDCSVVKVFATNRDQSKNN